MRDMITNTVDDEIYEDGRPALN